MLLFFTKENTANAAATTTKHQKLHPHFDFLDIPKTTTRRAPIQQHRLLQQDNTTTTDDDDGDLISISTTTGGGVQQQNNSDVCDTDTNTVNLVDDEFRLESYQPICTCAEQLLDQSMLASMFNITNDPTLISIFQTFLPNFDALYQYACQNGCTTCFTSSDDDTTSTYCGSLSTYGSVDLVVPLLEGSSSKRVLLERQQQVVNTTTTTSPAPTPFGSMITDDDEFGDAIFDEFITTVLSGIAYSYQVCIIYDDTDTEVNAGDKVCFGYNSTLDQLADSSPNAGLPCILQYNNVACTSCTLLGNTSADGTVECYMADCSNLAVDGSTSTLQLDNCAGIGLNGPFRFLQTLATFDNTTVTVGSCDGDGTAVDAPPPAAPASSPTTSTMGGGAPTTTVVAPSPTATTPTASSSGATHRIGRMTTTMIKVPLLLIAWIVGWIAMS